MPKNIKRSVANLDFVGWNYLENLVHKAKYPARELILVCFKTGGRISEVLSLKRDDFTIMDDFVRIRMQVVKRYKKIKNVEKWRCAKCKRRWGEEEPEENQLKGCRIGDGLHEVEKYIGYRTHPIKKFRRIDIPRNEPLSNKMINFINSCKGLLFPHPRDPDKPMNRSYAYLRVVEVDEDIWLHWLRAQRACQLADEVGFTLRELQDWFAWKNPKTARLYSSRRFHIREKISNPPRRIR